MTNNILFDDKEKRSRDKREQDLFDNFEKTFSFRGNNFFEKKFVWKNLFEKNNQKKNQKAF